MGMIEARIILTRNQTVNGTNIQAILDYIQQNIIATKPSDVAAVVTLTLNP